MEYTTVTDLEKANKLKFLYGYYNIIDCGVRTGKTYWAVHNLQKYAKDNDLSRILFLTPTTALKDQICQEYSDFVVEADHIWEQQNNYPQGGWGEKINKMGVMCYQRLQAYAIKDQLDFLNNIDVICWDECDNIFNFAASALDVAYKKDFARKGVEVKEVLAIIQRYSSNPEYSSLVLLKQWEDIVNEGRILCIGLTATPERARFYYDSLWQMGNDGSLTASYKIVGDIFYYNIMSLIRILRVEPNHGYWVYSPWIENNKAIVEAAQRQGFRAIELHSKQNNEKPMDEEQARVYDLIVEAGIIPYEYDFVVYNDSLLSGITLRDTRFDRVIIDSLRPDTREQACRQTFPYQRYLKSPIPRIPDSYMNRNLSLEECRELAKQLHVCEYNSKTTHIGREMTWNKLKDILPIVGYEITSGVQRVDGTRKHYYRITGQWHYVEVREDAFLTLVEAHNGNIEDKMVLSPPDISYDSKVEIPEEYQDILWTN